jgi:hypothetical protein
VLIVPAVAVGVQARHQLPSAFAAARRGNQFVTGVCAQDSDCQQGCCAFTTGKCAGPGSESLPPSHHTPSWRSYSLVAQTRDGGCGFGTKAPNCNVAKALGLSDCVAGAVNGNLADPAIQAAAAFTANLDGLKFTPAAANNAAAAAAPAPAPPAAQSAKKTVFTACASDSECQQGCCGFTSGKCAGPDVAQTNGSGGCGHGAAAPNCDVASALGFKNCIAGATVNTADPLVQAAAAFAAQLDGLKFTPSSNNAAAAAPAPAAAAPAAAQSSKKTVFIECASDSECQQGCCGFTSGKCAGPDVAQTNGSGGCGHGAAAPNCDVASALGFKNCIAGATINTSDPLVRAAAAFAAQLDGIAFTQWDMYGVSK